MSPRFSIVAAAVIAALFAPACASTHGATQPASSQPSAVASVPRVEASIHVDKRPDETVTTLDEDRDGKPDVWVYSVGDRVTRKEFDLNHDGKVDLVRYFNAQGQIEKETYDLDYDGQVDQVTYYENGLLVRKERDLDYDGRPDLWIYYDPAGKIVRKERDTNGDGKVDYWEYWKDDQIDRIGEDLDGDGTVDRWTRGGGSDSSGS